MRNVLALEKHSYVCVSMALSSRLLPPGSIALCTKEEIHVEAILSEKAIGIQGAFFFGIFSSSVTVHLLEKENNKLLLFQFTSLFCCDVRI